MWKFPLRGDNPHDWSCGASTRPTGDLGACLAGECLRCDSDTRDATPKGSPYPARLRLRAVGKRQHIGIGLCSNRFWAILPAFTDTTTGDTKP